MKYTSSRIVLTSDGQLSSETHGTHADFLQKTRSDKEIGRLTNKVDKLESLCRALQVERNRLTADATSNSDGRSTSKASDTEVEQGGAADGGCLQLIEVLLYPDGQ